MGSLALIYMLLGAEFVAVVQVIIYAGAIMVLFVFVIMLLNAGEEEYAQGQQCRQDLRHSRPLSLGGIIGIWVLLQHVRRSSLSPSARSMAPPTRSA